MNAMNKKWLLYGAYGYTGRLLLEEATRRGHRPVISGRSGKKLSELAERYRVEAFAIDLNDERKLLESLKEVELVFNAAGPFIYTSEPIVRACLKTGTNYVDITGEIPVFQMIFSFDEEARKKRICFLPGAGFDVVPTDCLAKYLSEGMPDASSLELAFLGLTVPSAGTAKTMIEMLPQGGLIRRNGALELYPMGSGAKRIRFPKGKYLAVPIPWGDLETAYRSTGIPNVTTLIVYPEAMIRGMRIFSPLIGRFTSVPPFKRLLQRIMGVFITGPGERIRERGRSYIYGMVKNSAGLVKEAWLETPEVYRFTAIAGVRVVEEIFKRGPSGALTPSLAFGADFVLTIEGTKRYDILP